MKKKKVEKSDILFLTVGTNPFPNLVSILTRVKEGGYVHFFYTSDEHISNTNKVYQKTREFIEKKGLGIKVDGCSVDKNKIKKIEEAVLRKLEVIFQTSLMQNKRIELNYTGGTKVMSAGSYSAFKKYALHKKDSTFILSYIDGEKEKILYEIMEEQIVKEISQPLNQLDSNVELNIYDIGNVHDLNLQESLSIYDWQLGEKLFHLFIDPSEKEYEENIEFLGMLLRPLYKIRKYAIKNKKKVNERTKSKYAELEEEFNAILQSEINPFSDVLKLEDFAIKERNISFQLVESLRGFWLEDYIHKLLLDIKEEDRIITHVSRSVKPNIKKDKKDFEVDFVVLKKYKIFSISVTTMEKEKDTIHKLFEVKERAKQIGGDESGICFISLYKDSKRLEERFKNSWDQESPKNTLIIGQDRFKDIKRILKEWVGV